ncbi:MAG TPA: ribosome-binding factor A [Acidimicrobiales bacterium]|nr:ribosome-binding factor A [Acidimicrobiales bacterium]
MGEVLREVVAEELEKVADDDERLGLLTVTSVVPDRDLSHATVYLASMSDEVATALEEHRYKLQAAIGRQVRMKRTPILTFTADPAVQTGQRVEDILRGLGAPVGDGDVAPE